MEGLTTVVIVIKTMRATRVLSKTVSANSPIPVRNWDFGNKKMKPIEFLHYDIHSITDLLW